MGNFVFVTAWNLDCHLYSYILMPSKNTTYKYQQINNILEFWQHVSAVKSHYQAKIQQCLGKMKVCTLWDPISSTIISTLKVICWLMLKEEHMSLNLPTIINDMGSNRVHTVIVHRHCSILVWWWHFTAETRCQNSKILLICCYLYVVFLDSIKI